MTRSGEPVTVAIRERTAEDLPDRPRYVVCNPTAGQDWTVFGMVQGGDTREEAVFWAERLASKNGLCFERPEGWENVVGALPPVLESAEMSGPPLAGERWIEVRCPTCGVRAGCGCVDPGTITDLYNAEFEGRQIGHPHVERVERARGFEGRERWACHKPGCEGSRMGIESGEMISSSEGGCNICEWWVDDPAHTITADELLRSLAPELVEEHELVANPDAPHGALAMEERAPILIGEPSERDAQYHLVPRTKPPEWNPRRPLCTCGHEKPYHDPECPFEGCDCRSFTAASEETAR